MIKKRNSEKEKEKKREKKVHHSGTDASLSPFEPSLEKRHPALKEPFPLD